MVSREELNKKVPFGYKGIIAERAGVTRKTVSEYFSKKNNNEKVEMALLETLAELQIKKRELLKEIE